MNFMRQVINIIVAGIVLELIYVIAVGPLKNIDQSFLFAVVENRNDTLNTIMVGVTYLGNPILLGLAVLSLIYFIYRHRYTYATLLAVGGIGAYALKVILKFIFARPRPEIVTSLVVENSASFPSGHALAAIVFYGFLAWVLWQGAKKRIVRIAIAVVASFIILAVGFSRVYLGVHWPSDIVAGYVVGGWWLITLLTARSLFEFKWWRAST